MGRYLVTGRAGSGKSAVSEELRQRGFVAFDSDNVIGLSSWFDRESHKPVILKDNRYVDLNKYQWLWKTQVVQELVSQHQNMFLCGGAENDLTFTSLFDDSFVLSVNPDNQVHRLLTRKNNDYGQDTAMHAQIIRRQAVHLDQALKQGAHVIDANQPISAVVEQILGYCNDN